MKIRYANIPFLCFLGFVASMIDLVHRQMSHHRNHLSLGASETSEQLFQQLLGLAKYLTLILKFFLQALFQLFLLLYRPYHFVTILNKYRGERMQ